MINNRVALEAMPHRTSINFGDQKCEVLARTVKAYAEGTQLVAPDSEAIGFYGANQLAMLVAQNFTPHEKLPDFAVNALITYRNTLAAQATRLYNYTLLTVVREARHVHHDAFFTANFKLSLIDKYGPDVVQFLIALKNAGSTGAVGLFYNKPPAAKISDLLGAITDIFYKGTFSGGYGGKPWGDIAKNLLNATTGVISLEAMVDTGYTLAHNNGPMFNKGMLYRGYSGDFITILDIQRSGQIINLLLGGEWSKKPFIKTANLNGLKASIADMYAAIPNVFSTYVDWFAVEATSPSTTYIKEKAEQVKKYKVQSITAKSTAQKNKNGNFYQVDTQNKVKIVKLEREAEGVL